MAEEGEPEGAETPEGPEPLNPQPFRSLPTDKDGSPRSNRRKVAVETCRRFAMEWVEIRLRRLARVMRTSALSLASLKRGTAKRWLSKSQLPSRTQNAGEPNFSPILLYFS